MRSLRSLVVVAHSCLLSSAVVVPAWASPPESARADTPASRAEIQPHEVDVKASLRTSPVLQHAGIGVGGDVGVKKVGPGTIAVGGSIGYEACGSTCWGAPLDLSQHTTWLEARGSYHLAPSRIGYLDVYPLL